MFDIRTHNLAVVNPKPSRELVSVVAKQQTIPKQSHEQAWPAEGLTRAPYLVFQTEESDRDAQLGWRDLCLREPLRADLSGYPRQRQKGL
jgi:hypothetical protein